MIVVAETLQHRCWAVRYKCLEVRSEPRLYAISTWSPGSKVAAAGRRSASLRFKLSRRNTHRHRTALGQRAAEDKLALNELGLAW